MYKTNTEMFGVKQFGNPMYTLLTQTDDWTY